MAKKISEIKEQAASIAKASAPSSNTASKVGGTIKDIVEYIESQNSTGGGSTAAPTNDLGNIEVSYDGDRMIEVSFPECGNRNFEITAASKSKIGLMTSADKKKLDNLEFGQGYFSNSGGGYMIQLGHTSTIIPIAADPNFVGLIYTEDYEKLKRLKEPTKATTSQDGLMSKEDKAKLDGLNVSANASTITVTTIATPSNNGLMSASDKRKLDALSISGVYKKSAGGYEVSDGNTSFILPPVNSSNNLGLMTSEDYEKLQNLESYTVATASQDGLMSKEDKAKLDGLNQAASPSKATTSQDGLMSKEDKAKLDGLSQVELPDIATWAKNGLMSKEDKIRIDEFFRSDFIRNGGTSSGISLKDIPLASEYRNGLMSAADKTRLSNMRLGHSHPSKGGIMITLGPDETLLPLATTSKDGIMSKEDKEKLDKLSLNGGVTTKSIRTEMLTANSWHKIGIYNGRKSRLKLDLVGFNYSDSLNRVQYLEIDLYNLAGTRSLIIRENQFSHLVIKKVAIVGNDIYVQIASSQRIGSGTVEISKGELIDWVAASESSYTNVAETEQKV